MNLDEVDVTAKGISARVMWPWEASSGHGRRYAPAAKPVASAESVSAGVCLLISSACTEPSGWISVRRERSASMRTLKRSMIGTFGPDTAPFRGGFDSISTACAAAGAAIKKAAATAIRMSAQRFLRPGCMTFPFAKNGEKLRESYASIAGRKLYRSGGGLLFHSEAASRTGLFPRPAKGCRKSAGGANPQGGQN